MADSAGEPSPQDEVNEAWRKRYWELYKTTFVGRGFHHFRYSVFQQLAQGTERVKVQRCDFRLKDIDGFATTQHVRRLARAEEEALCTATDTFCNVRSESNKHDLTYLVDADGIHFATVTWKAHDRAAADGIRHQVQSLFENACDSTSNVAHAILQSSGEGPEEQKLAYNANFVDNIAVYSKFLLSEPLQCLVKRVRLAYQSSFPHHAADFFRMARLDVCKALVPCQGFLFGLHSSLAISRESSTTITRPHCDTSDLLVNLCCVVPFGNFDVEKEHSGALLLYDAKVRVLLRPGDLCFFPSALMAHGVAPLQRQDTRGSIVAYTPARLARHLQTGSTKAKSEEPEKAQAWHDWLLHCWTYFAPLVEKADVVKSFGH